MKKKVMIKFNIIAVLCIIIFCATIAPITLQNDTYYTISIGQHILENGIDMHDPFSWHNIPYTYPHWGYDVFIYLIYSAFGMTGIYISTCVLSVILGLLIYTVNCKIAKNHAISFIITLISIYLLKDYIAARAQLVTFILFILEILFIEQFLSTKKRRYAIGLIILPIIIANVHVAVWPFYFVLFLPYIAEYIIAVIADFIMDRKLTQFRIKTQINRLSKKFGNEEKIAKLHIKLANLNIKIDKAKEKRSQAKKEPYKIKLSKNNTVKWLIIIITVCLLTGFLTPLGNTPYTYLLNTMQGNTTENINEHLPMTIANHDDILCLVIAYLSILIFTKTKLELRDLFMISGLAFLMLKSRRQSTMFALIGSIILNKMIYELIETYLKKGTEKKIINEVTTKAGAFVIIALTLGVSLHFVSEKKDNNYVDESTYPVSACDYILANVDIENSRFYNDYNFGSYMLFRGIPVFIDSRADLYAPEFNTPTGNPEDGKDIFMDFIEVSGIAKYYEPMFDDYNMTHVITYKNSKLAMLINNRGDEKYKEIYSDKYFVIYEIHR
ncbi:MAG: hypothetical protein IKF83_03115 [Clostridia bacterium]|nr:hypothetical protein [Clostridia bacterium]